MKRLPHHGTVAAYLALVIALSGTAYAATGGTFLLGKSNKADQTTKLHNTGSGAALALDADAGAPLSVGANDTKVGNLNADLLDGLSSGKLQRRVTGGCIRGSAIAHARANGTVSCNQQLMWAHVYPDGSLGGHSAGVAGSSLPAGTTYVVTFKRNVNTCTYFATVGPDTAGTKFVSGFATTEPGMAHKNVVVRPIDTSGSSANANFNLLVVC